MGNVTTPEALRLRWAEVIRDPVLRDLPYKVELNSWGKLEMSPASNRHGYLQAMIAAEFIRQLPAGIVVSEASVLTDIGIRVPDVIWGSAEFKRLHGDTTPYPRAPEICVEVVSPSNSDKEISEKIRAYLAAGSREVWIVDEAGVIRIVGADGERNTSEFPVSVSISGPGR